MPSPIHLVSRRPKRRLTIEEACSELKKARKKKTKRSEQRFKMGWTKIDRKTSCWQVKKIDTPTAGARLAKVKRTASISDVYFVVLPPAVLVEVRKDLGKENLLYGKKKVPIEDIYKMYAANLHLRASQPHVDKGKVKNVFREVYKTTINYFNEGCLGVRKYSFLRKNFKISPTVAWKNS